MSKKAVLDKISDIILSTDASYYLKLIEMIDKAPRIFVAGAGRSGLAAQFFAMRLMHAGCDVCLAGGIVTPSIKKGDVLIVLSGSGETESMISVARRAKKAGAAVVAISSKKSSTLGDLADFLCQIGREDQYSKMIEMPMGTTFELSALLYLEILIAEIIQKKGISEEEMRSRHANLE